MNDNIYFQKAASRALTRCDQLAACSEEEGRITRLFLSPALRGAHELIGAWMREAGMTTRVDDLGNLIGHYAGASEDAPLFLLGSHLDSVPNAGKYDGVLGVLLAIEAVAALDGARLPFALEVLGFSDEEGIRYGTPYLGSRALAGTFDEALLQGRDEREISMRDAIVAFGLDPDWRGVSYAARKVAGYLETHIEQGPVLESEGAPLGIVSAIAGQSRWRVRFFGQAGHAGTLPMHFRRDALAAASEWILAVEATARQSQGLFATVGMLTIDAGAANVVPGEVECSLDVRHANDGARGDAVAELLDAAQEIALRRGVEIETRRKSEQSAVPMNTRLRAHLATAVAQLGVAAPSIVSGAGHDAVIISALCPVAMLFLRTPGGASHCPDEAVWPADVELALRALSGFLALLSGEAAPKKESEIALV